MLSTLGFNVYTAPVANGGDPVPASCLGGQNTPDIPSGGSTVIDSNGELTANQGALVAFLTFLHQAYGIAHVALVGHSDGGLWSRAAITQLRDDGSPVTIDSLTTIGTPHTGSFGADLAVAIGSDGGSCSDLSGIEYAVCVASYQAVQAIFADLGKDAVEELSSGWLGQWNPTTSIGCPVTTLGGNHVGFDLGVGTYYSANDGIVGQASALNQSTWIPALRAAPFTPVAPPGGLAQLYDAVHSPSLTFIYPATELNTLALALAVGSAVSSPPSGPCATATTSGLRVGGASAAGVRASAAVAPVTASVPLRAHEAVHTGSFDRLRSGDALVLLRGASARCEGRPLPTVPVLGSARLRMVAGACPAKVVVRGRVLRLSQAPAKLRLARDGRTLRYRLTGAPLHRVRVQLRRDGRWRTVRGGHVTVPGGGHDPALRVRAVDAHGTPLRAITRIPA